MEKENTENDLPEGRNRNAIDIDAILLPKKEAPPSTQRVNAGVLLEQEQSATLLKSNLPEQKTSNSTSLEKVLGGPRFAGQEGANLAPDFSSESAVSAIEKESGSEVPSLQTYRDDIQKVIKKDNVSVVTIAAAEAGRRNITPAGATPAPKPEISLAKVVMIAGGVLLTLSALALVAYFFVPRSVPVEQTAPAPFIAVDATSVVPFAASASRASALASLQDAETNMSLSLGLVGRLLPATKVEGANTQTAIDAQTFLQLLAPNIPADLLRTIQPTFLLGVHVFDVNQPFLILKVDAYEQAYSGMLAWEASMHSSLSPLFDYTPRQHIPEENLATSTTPAGQSPLGGATFVDRIVANHDARVLQNNTGDIYFLWTFLDRNTIVITTQENTLREIILRATEAPIVPLPQ